MSGTGLRLLPGATLNGCRVIRAESNGSSITLWLAGPNGKPLICNLSHADLRRVALTKE